MVLAVAFSMVLGPGAAAADVIVEPDHVEPGARDVTLVVRMTPDDPTAPVARLQLLLPTGRPLVGVTAPALAGWTARLTTTRLDVPAPSVDGPVREAVSVIEWTATAPEGGEAVAFPVHVDLMPDGAGPVRFRAVQTDVAGRTVEWSDIRTEGAPPPEHDALVLRLGSAAPPPVVVGPHDHHHGGAADVALPADPATGGAAMTVGGLLVFAAAVGALTVALGRRQQRRFESLPAERDDPGPRA